MTSTKPLVLLTGATGFVGAHVLDQLLGLAKYRVLAPVRSTSKAKHFLDKYSKDISAGNLTFTTNPDLSAPHALDSILEDNKIAYIIHLASPYFTTSSNPIEELVKPAVNATRNVLLSALAHGEPDLKRLTVLSSFASVVDLSKNPRPGYQYTSEEWDPVTEEEAAQNGVLGYHASKTFAEREAWKLHDIGPDESGNPQKAKFALTTLCPPMIYGPPIHYSPESVPKEGITGLNTSTMRLITGILGKDPLFAPKVATPGLPAWIDVRDIAKALIATIELPDDQNERVLLSGGVSYYEDGLKGLRPQGVQGLGEPGALVNPANHFSLDQSKQKAVLGLKEPIPFQKTVEDTYEAVKALGLL